MKIKHNQETDFNLCESNEEAIKSEAWKLWLITVLRSVYSNKEVNKYIELLDWLFNKTINLDELLELQKVFSNIEVINRWKEYISDNIMLLENVEKYNITIHNISIYINNLIIQQKVLIIMWLQFEWLLKEILNNETFLIYKQANIFIIFNKKTEEKKVYDVIIKEEYWYYLIKWDKSWVLDHTWEELIPYGEYNVITKEKYWYEVIKSDKWWILDSNWKEFIPCKYDGIIKEEYWYVVMQWKKWWVLDNAWEEIIPCEYNDIRKLEYWYNLRQWGKRWVLDNNWKEFIPCKYDEIIKKEYWYKVRKWDKWWVLDNNWEELFI